MPFKMQTMRYRPSKWKISIIEKKLKNFFNSLQVKGIPRIIKLSFILWNYQKPKIKSWKDSLDITSKK